MEPRGFKSRKLWLVILTQALIFAYALLAIRWPAAAGLFVPVSGAILAAAGMYLTANVGARIVDRPAPPPPSPPVA